MDNSPVQTLKDPVAPTQDEQAGMAWWNSLGDLDRAYYLAVAGTAVVAQAWAWFKLNRGHHEPA